MLDISRYWHFYTGKKLSSLEYTKQLLTEIQANFRTLLCYHKPEALAIKGVFEAISSSSTDLFCFGFFLSLIILIAFEKMNSLTAWRAGLA